MDRLLVMVDALLPQRHGRETDNCGHSPADRRCPADGSAVDVESALCYRPPCRLGPAGGAHGSRARDRRRHDGRRAAASASRVVEGDRSPLPPRRADGAPVGAGRGMPVHRHLHHARDSVYAFPDELDSWWEARSARRLTPPAAASAGAPVAAGLVCDRGGLPGRAVRRETCCRRACPRAERGSEHECRLRIHAAPARAGRSGRAGCIPVRPPSPDPTERPAAESPRLPRTGDDARTWIPRRTCPARRVVPPGGPL